MQQMSSKVFTEQQLVTRCSQHHAAYGNKHLKWHYVAVIVIVVFVVTCNFVFVSMKVSLSVVWCLRRYATSAVKTFTGYWTRWRSKTNAELQAATKTTINNNNSNTMSLQVLIHVCCVMLAASRYQLLLCKYFWWHLRHLKKRDFF